MLVEHQIIFFFCLSIIVAIFTKKLIVDKLDANKTQYTYVVSRGKSKNKVKRLGVEKICFGKVGLP